MDFQQPIKAASAAALAWLATAPMGGVVDDYDFYAPLGAVVAISTTVVGSLREAVQTMLAIAVGAVLASAVVPLPAWAGLVLVVAVGTLVADWPRFRDLGQAAGWLPISAMFVLVLGGDRPWEYATAYLALVSFGALVGLAVNALWPPLGLSATRQAIHDAREVLADQLEVVADGLRGDLPPTPDEWRQRLWAVRPVIGRMQDVAERTRDSRALNWRAWRWRSAADRLHHQVQALSYLAFLVEDLVELVQANERADLEEVALGPALRPRTADALADLAGVLVGDGDEDLVRQRAGRSTRALVEAVREQRRSTGGDLLAASGMANVVQRTLAALEPAEPDREPR